MILAFAIEEVSISSNRSPGSAHMVEVAPSKAVSAVGYHAVDGILTVSDIGYAYVGLGRGEDEAVRIWRTSLGQFDIHRIFA